MLSVTQLVAQKDTIVDLKTIEVTSTRIRSAPIGNEVTVWTISDLARNSVLDLAALLEREDDLFIKSYGLGGLATTASRGGSAGHTLLLWNGIPLHSPMLGLLDLSLIPLLATEQITLQKGGQSSLWGSGAVGAVIALQNQADFKNKLVLEHRTQLGSFGHLSQGLKVGMGNSTWQSVTKLIHRAARNNFNYHLDGIPEARQQTNAAINQQNIFQDFYLRKDKSHFSFHFWQQYSDREIPPLVTQTKSEAKQRDRATRVYGHWKHLQRRSLWQVRLAFISEGMDYTDPLTRIDTRNHFSTYIGDVSAQWTIRTDQHLLLGLTQSYTSADTDAYKRKVNEQRLAVFGSFRIHKPKWKTQATMRQSWLDGGKQVLLPSLGIEIALSKRLFFRGKISRNHRLPTLNHRYWIPGGNAQLKPEHGWSEEASLTYIQQAGKHKITTSATGFTRSIQDWILWKPTDNQLIWSPDNIGKVWSRGLESQLMYRYQHRDFTLQWKTNHTLVHSTNQIALQNPRIEKGSQLIYTPKHRWASNIFFGFNKIGLSYQHHFTSTALGINETLPSYWVGHLRMQYSVEQAQISGTFFLSIHNFWNNQYFVIERRPMPGRHLQLGLHLHFEKPNLDSNS